MSKKASPQKDFFSLIPKPLFFVFVGLCFSLYLFPIERKNIPMFDSNAQNVIYFCITKDFSNGALKASFLKELQDYFGIETFIESGTYLGNTAKVAAEIFSEVHTIEVFSEFYSQALERFCHEKNVFLHSGDSGKVLQTLLPSINKRTLFYLDGHYDGGAHSGKGDQNTPIVEELSKIRIFGRSDSIILIDDLCDFQFSFYPQKIVGTCFEGYPPLKDLVEELLRINADYQICFLGNALLAFLPSPQVTISPVVSSCAIDRLSTITDLFSEEMLTHAETTIGQASGFEKEALIHYYRVYAPLEENYGWMSFSSFWYGLIAQQNKRGKEALEIFRRAADSSLPGWRVCQYNKL